MPVSAGGGGLVKIASGSLLDIKSTTPKTLDFRTWPALANFGEIKLRLNNIRRGVGTLSRDLRMSFLVAGVEQITAYSGHTTGNNQTYLTLAEGLASFLNGYADINLSKFMTNDTPCFMNTFTLVNASSVANTFDNGGRGVAAIHDGLKFITPDTATSYQFDYTIFGVQK